MTQANLQTLKGFRDFLPETMIIRNEAIRRVKQVFEKYGFEELQTPYLEHQEVLLGKYGAEAEKLMYLFNDPGQRPVGLRYDLTVPLARVAATHPEITYPFKRYQIQPVWRAENTQKGRYREFYQCDVDTLGSNSPLADAEILAVIYESLQILEFPKFKIKINSRSVLFSAMEKTEIPKNEWLTVIQSVDKLDKKSKEEVSDELGAKGFKNEQIKAVFTSLLVAQPDHFLASTIEKAQKFGVDKNVLIFDSHLARGLDYYTGPIFETVVTEPKIGSITGGGRYDQLLKSLGAPDMPAVGTTIGLDRAIDVIQELSLWKNIPATKTQALITIFSPAFENHSLEIVQHLRKNGLNAEVYLSENTKLDKQLKYADRKGIPWLIVVGPDEAAKGTAILKNLISGEQENLFINQIVEKVSA